MSIVVLSIIVQVLNFYTILIIVYTLMSWFPMRGMLYDIYRVLASVVEPYVGVFRRFMPPLGGLDFSPFVAILVLQFVITALVRLA